MNPTQPGQWTRRRSATACDTTTTTPTPTTITSTKAGTSWMEHTTTVTSHGVRVSCQLCPVICILRLLLPLLLRL